MGTVTDTEGTAEERSARPVLRVVKGDPTPEELVALVTVVAASSARATPPTAPRSTWASPAHHPGVAPHAGRGAWRASALPR